MCHEGAPPVLQQLDGGDQQCVVRQRAEELRRHDGVEAFFHSLRVGGGWTKSSHVSRAAAVIARGFFVTPAAGRRRSVAGRIPPMPRPIEALVHARGPRGQPRGGAPRRRRRQGLGGRQGQRLRPRHRQRLRRPEGRRRLRPARPGRGRAAARARLARPDPAARRLLRRRATSTPARASISGTRSTTRRRSTGWPRTRRRCRTRSS